MNLSVLRPRPSRQLIFTPLTLVLGLTLWAAWSYVAQAQQAPVFVTLRTSQVTANTTPTMATTATINAPGSGWAYSAAAQTTGTTWNQILRPNPLIGTGTANGVVGSYICNSANNIALTSATGGTTSLKLTATINVADLDSGTTNRTEPNTGTGSTTALGPTGLMDQPWRIYRGGNSLVMSVTGLTPNARYYLYVYGSTTTATQGCKFILASANVPSGGAASVELPGGNSGNIFALSGSTYSLTTAGTTWQLLDTVADYAGTIAFTASKNSSNFCYFNGFQLVPFPLPVITAQPPSTATATVGSDFSVSVTATGIGTLTYQWQKGDGTNFTNIDPAANPSAATSTLTLRSVQNADAASYRAVVTNSGGSVVSSSTALTVSTDATAASVQLSPSSQTVLAGQAVAFTVTANGTSPLSYQWQKSTDGFQTFSVVGPNASTYSIASAQLSDAASYRAVVSNSLGSATSDPATLTVNQAPAISAQPVGGVVASGAAYTLSVGATGSPAPTYQWQRSVDGLNFTNVSGATSAALPLTLTSSNSGFYRVAATNVVGSVTSAIAYAGVASTSLGSPTFGPVANATGANPDQPLSLVFGATPVVGSTGRVRVFDAATNVAVATIDLSQVATINLTASGGAIYGIYHYTNKVIQGDTYYSQPVLSIGNQPAPSHLPTGASSPNTKQALIVLPTSATLSYGKTYYVNIEPGVFVDANGATFPGISDTTTWRFTTKSAGPVTGSTSLSVAADGSGDFSTVQGAVDFVPNSNTQPVTINIVNGIYYEQVHVKSPFVTLKGQSQNGTVIAYLANNNTINATGSTNANSNVRNVLRFNTSDCALQSLSVYNLTPNGGSQAEAFRPNGQRNIANHVSLYSYQDTFLADGQLFLTDSYVEGAVDYMWGGAVLFAQRCELKANVSGSYYTQARNGGPGVRGFAYVNCTLDSYSGVPAGSCYLSRSFADGYPYTQTIYVNCKMGTHIAPVGWNIATGTTGSVQLWEYQSKDLSGNLLSTSSRASYNRAYSVSNGTIVYTAGATSSPDVLPNQQVSATMAALFSTPLAQFGNWNPAVPLTIDAQPASQAVALGQAVTFSATITGAPDPTYQWYKNGSPISGATGATYSIASAAGADYGSYAVVATNSSGSVASAAAALTFSDPQTNFSASYGLDPATNGAPSADPDNDGINNKLEFFLGGDPTVASEAILPVGKMAANGSSYTFEFNRRNSAANTAYLLEYTADLTAGWTTLVVGQNGVTQSSAALDANTTHFIITVPAAAIPGDKSKFFMHLKL